MAFCPNCGTELIQNANFCMNCGYKINESDSLNNENKSTTTCNSIYISDAVLEEMYKTESSNKFKMIKKIRESYNLDLKDAEKIVDSYFQRKNKIVSPIEVSSKKKKKGGCGTLFWIFFIIIILYSCSSSTDEGVEPLEKINSQTEENKEKDQQTYYTNINLENKYKNNFIEACISCNIDPDNISSLNKQENWYSGERYSFYYNGATHEVYFLDNGTVNSINYSGNNNIKIYEQGYESLDINDFIVTTEMYASLQIAAENVVKTNLNYPNTADFNWFTTGHCTRYYDYYIIGCEFTAENAFGLEDTHYFRIDCSVNGDTSNFLYYELDGNVMSGNSKVPEIVKIPIESETKNEEGIKISYGIKGTYGEEDKFDGENHLRYYIPEGKYEVTCETKGSGFFIETIELHKEDGFDTARVIEKIVFSSTEESYTVEIKEGECVSLIINSIVNFKIITE